MIRDPKVGDTKCIEHRNKPDHTGYVKVTLGKKRYLVHRLSYLLHNGPLVAGLEIDHLCNNKKCINPNHLDQVSPRENKLRSNGIAGINSRKTHCKRGHAYTPDNIYSSDGRERQCRICKPKLRKAYYERTKKLSRTTPPEDKTGWICVREVKK